MTIQFLARTVTGFLGLAVLGTVALGQIMPPNQTPGNRNRTTTPPLGGIRQPVPFSAIPQRPPTGLAPTPAPRIIISPGRVGKTTPPTHPIKPVPPIVAHPPTTSPPTISSKPMPPLIGVRPTIGVPSSATPTTRVAPSSTAVIARATPTSSTAVIAGPGVTLINNGTIIASSTVINTHPQSVRVTRNVTNINIIDPLLFPGGIIRPGIVIRPIVIWPWGFSPFFPFGVFFPGSVFVNGGGLFGVPVAAQPFVTPVPVPVPAAAPAVAQRDVRRPPLPAMVPAGGDAPGAAPVPDKDNAVVVQAFTTRFIRIQNDTGEKMKVALQYRARTDKGEWGWFPADPREQGDQALTYELDTGKGADLVDGQWRINASLVRVWAVSATGQKWFDYKDKDLSLVTEKNAQGDPEYLAAEMETFLFNFAR